MRKKGLFERIDIPNIYNPTLKAKVTTIGCGKNHFAAVSGGSLFTWGVGPKGQLGLGKLIEAKEPTLVGKSKIWYDIIF